MAFTSGQLLKAIGPDVAQSISQAEALTILGLSSLSLPLQVALGGTGATSAGGARTNLGLGTVATLDSTTSVGTPGSDSLIPTEKAVRTAIAASSGVPAGGTAGQLIVKQSGTDYDVAWETLDYSDFGAAAAAHNHAASEITSGTLNIARIPTGALVTTVCIGNDARLSDARTPTAHAASHAVGGADTVFPAVPPATRYLQCDSGGNLTWGASTGGVAWDAITSPTGNQTLGMQGYLSTWNYISNSNSNLFTITDDDEDTGTGFIVSFESTNDYRKPLNVSKPAATNTTVELLRLTATSLPSAGYGPALDYFFGGATFGRIETEYSGNAWADMSFSLYSSSNGAGSGLSKRMRLTDHGFLYLYGTNTAGEGPGILFSYGGAVTSQIQSIKAGNHYGDLAFSNYPSGGPLTEWMRLTSAGLLGIGTDSPDAKVDIESGGVRLNYDKGYSVFLYGELLHYGDGDSPYNVNGGLRITALGSSGDGNSSGDIRFFVSAAGTAEQRMVLRGRASGLLGLNCTDPQNQFSLGLRTTTILTGTDQAAFNFYTTASSPYIRTLDIVSNGDYDGSANGGGQICFYTNPPTTHTASRRLIITKDGDIGIGVDAPTVRLDVSGSIKASSQLVSSVATGTAPLSVASTTAVSNLNADLLDGNHASAFQTALTNPVTGTGTSGYIPKFSGTSAIANSIISESGSLITIGGAAQIDGYTKLGGSSAPAVKVKKITGTTNASNPGSVSIAHGLTGAKILSYSAIVEYSTNYGVCPNDHVAADTYLYSAYLTDQYIVIVNGATSVSILSKPVRITIIYEE